MVVTASSIRTILAAGFIALVSQPTMGSAQEEPVLQAKQVMAAVLDAYGGKEAVAGVTSVVARGTITDFMRKSEGAYARYYARPQKLRIEILADPAGELRILNGNRGWRGSPTTQVEVQGAPLQAMLYQYTYLDLPMGFIDSTYTVSYEGTKELRGRPLELLTVETKGTPKVRVYLDPETKRIIRVASQFNMGMGSSELSTEYEDFRKVGKILFPFRLVNYAGEKKLSVISLSEIQLNPELAENRFLPPAEK